jgi:flagellar motor switch protein FliG
MTMIDPNLRKAAVLLRSLDADTAAMMLGQLSPDETSAIRSAMRALGAVESDEQANVVAELRRSQPGRKTPTAGDVELSLSSAFDDELGAPYSVQSTAVGGQRFEFLASAPTHTLVRYLAREHVQTIAVVLSHLAPERAAAVLAALPQRTQADTIERLSALGETDPETVSVLERELEAWITKRDGARSGGRRRDTMTAILAAADAKARTSILRNMKSHHATQASQLAAKKAALSYAAPAKAKPALKLDRRPERPAPHRTTSSARTAPRVVFDDLIRFDARLLASVLRQVDANILALALAGSRDELVDRICEQMPKRTARTFRRELRRLGPTRLSDVEAAQHAVARIASRQVTERQQTLVTAHS